MHTEYVVDENVWLCKKMVITLIDKGVGLDRTSWLYNWIAETFRKLITSIMFFLANLSPNQLYSLLNQQREANRKHWIKLDLLEGGIYRKIRKTPVNDLVTDSKFMYLTFYRLLGCTFNMNEIHTENHLSINQIFYMKLLWLVDTWLFNVSDGDFNIA